MSEELKPINNDYCIIDFRGHKIIIDNQDTWLFFKYYYTVEPNGRKTHFYLKRNVTLSKGKYVKRLLHRDILGVCDPAILVDHINGNTLDNRRCNLRIVDYSQSNLNRKIQSRSKTGVTGVLLCKMTNKYRAAIRLNKKHMHLGYYSNIEDAINARKQAESMYCNDYVRKMEA